MDNKTNLLVYDLIVMTKILANNKDFQLVQFNNEAELEKVVVQNYDKIFGQNTYYFDIKKWNRYGRLPLAFAFF